MSETRVIEIMHVPIQQGVDVLKVMRELASKICDAPGMLSQYCGLRVEDPTVMDLIAGNVSCIPPDFGSKTLTKDTGWENIEAHIAFAESDQMMAVVPLLQTLQDSTRASESYHIPYSEDLDKVLTAPVIEICRFKNMPSTFEEKVDAFHEETKKLEEQKGVVNGWVIEKGEEEKEMVALVAWESIEAHGLAMQKKHILKALEKAREHMGDVSFHHAVFTKYER